MDKQEIINSTEAYVKEVLQNAEKGHDWFHIERVWHNAKNILNHENANAFIVQIAVLLHDIADSKFYDGDEEVAPKIVRDFLRSHQIDQQIIDIIIDIIKYMSFKNSLDENTVNHPITHTIEFKVVQDADRLDAIGAIGIARAFQYGGFKNRLIYDPDQKPNLRQSKEAYKKSKAPTINHFYEKLLLLKDKMNTQTAKQMAEERHAFMLNFLQQFFKETNY